MSEPFLGELKIISWNFPPKGWAFANGQLLPINQNQALFSLFGTMYGGDGRVNFALPDLRGRVPMHLGSGFTQGQRGGETAHTVTSSEMPAHNHFVSASNSNGSTNSGSGQFLGAANNLYFGPSNLTTLHPSTIGNFGGSQAHNNMQPYLVLNIIVALQGIFPSRN